MRQQWLPIGLIDDLAVGSVQGTVLADRELVMWRDSRGVSHVWADRCPHRGMRLSLGFLRADNLSCPYHGWRFDASGRCALIPAHPDLGVAPSINAQVLPSTEFAGLLWVGPDSRHTPLPQTDQPDLSDASGVRTVTVYAPPAVVARHAREARPKSVQAHWNPDSVLSRFSYLTGEALVAFQPMTPARTAMHLACIGLGSDADRATLARWGAQVRVSAEAEAYSE